MPLSDVQARNFKPEKKIIRKYDERGLYLEIAPNGAKGWRFKYKFEGKEKRISLGIYPDVSLKDAREKRDEARKLVAAGVDPSENRKAIKMASAESAANSFEVLAREWVKKQSAKWSEGHAERLLKSFEKDIFPWFGTKPVSKIKAPELLTTLQRIEAREAGDTAHRLLSNCFRVFRYAIASGRAEINPADSLKGALTIVKGGHFAAVTEPKKVGELLRMLDSYLGTPTVGCALKLAPLVFVRPGELRTMEWADVNFETAEWRFIATKTKTQHIVPLAIQSIKILRELQPLTGSSRFVFPSLRTNAKPMCNNAILAAFRRLGIGKDEMSGHGFRAMARTILDEVLRVRPDFIEHQLAHAVRDPNGRAYNRTAHLPERHKMMQQWADYLDGVKKGSVKVVSAEGNEGHD